MRRERAMLVRVSHAEFASIKRLAEREKIPPASLARRLLLLEAERQGVLDALQEGNDGNSERRVNQ